MTLNNCTLEISDSGRILSISYNNHIICKLLVHGFMKRAIESAEMRACNVKVANFGPISKYILYGEVYQLANYEQIDINTETIKEWENV